MTILAARDLASLPALDLRTHPAGAPLQDRFVKGFEYSDCWVEDSRLVVLNARSAQDHGATIRTRTRFEARGGRRSLEGRAARLTGRRDGIRQGHRQCGRALGA